jgi:very-long-chain ceramide synthase
MSNIPAVDAVHNEEIGTSPKWVHTTGSNGIGRDGKLDNADSEEFTSPTKIIRKKGKRKDDDLLENVCGWIVDHQIGI